MNETANMKSAGEESGAKKRGPGRRILKAVGIGLLCLAGLAVVLVALLLLPPVRGAILRVALPRAVGYVPGDLTIERAGWPDLERFEVYGIAWDAGGETVLSADTVLVEVSLWPLISRDIKAKTVLVHGLIADIPGITSLFPPDTTALGEPEKPEDEASGFPRPGVIPGLPSVAVDSLSVRAPYIRLSEGSGLGDLVFAGGFDFSSGGTGAVRVHRLEVTGQGSGYSVGHLSLDANLREGTLEGEGAGSYADGYPVTFAAESTAPDEVTVTLAREKGLRPPDDPGVAARITFEREDGRVVGIGFDVEMRTPSAEELAGRGTAQGRRESMLPPESVSARASGNVRLEPKFGVRARCVVREPSLLERGMVALDYEDNTVTLDSLSLAFPQGLTLRTAAEIILDGDVRVDIEALAVEVTDSVTAWRPTGERSGMVLYSRRTGIFRIEGLQVTGDFGDMAIEGEVNGEGTGRFDISAVWPEPPAPLYTLLGDEPELADSLRAAWAVDAPYSLEAAVTLSKGEGRREFECETSVNLPGPRGISPLLSGSADVGAFGPVLGDVTFEFATGDTVTGTPAAFDLVMDLTRTAWLDTANVRVSGAGDSIRVDEFLVHTREVGHRGALRFAIEGAFNKTVGTGHARATIADDGFLRRMSRSVPDMNLALEATFAGAADSLTAREIHARLDGEVTGAAYHIPSLAGSLALDAAGLRAEVRLPEGLASSHVHLDMLVLDFASTDSAAIFPATIGLSAVGSEYRFRQRMDLTLGDTIVCAVDTLKATAYGGDLETTTPFRISVVRETGAFALDNMRIAGSSGEISASGYAGPEGVDFRCNVGLDLPESPPPGLDVPRGAWPHRLDADLSIPAANDLKLEARVAGFVLDDGSAAELSFELAGTDTGVSSAIALDSGGERLVDGSLFLPAGITAYPPVLDYRGGDVSVHMSLSGYPVLVRERAGGNKRDDLVARIDADVKVSGSAQRPAAYVGANVRFPDWPDMADFSIKLEGAVRPDSLEDAELRPRAIDLTDRVARTLGLDRAEMLVAELTMRRGESTLLEGELSYPVSFAFDPFEFGTGEGRMEAALKSDGLPLEDIDVFLPEDTGLDGMMTMDLAASGPAEDPEISGNLGMSDLRVKYTQLVNLLMQGDLEVGGTASKPAVTGDLAIQSGTINLPEKPKEMHPVEGNSILLDTAWRPGPDSSDVGLAGEKPAGKDTVETQPEKAPFEVDYDINLDIARGFWLRGEGLEIELEGELQVAQQKGVPIVSGDLNAMRGSFLFLGRVFTLERGTISFFGEEELNPSLDLTVTSAIEGYNLFIKLGGTLEKPELTLTSDPDLPEGDIVAMIVFGKPLDSLNEGEGNMLQQRTAEIAIAMGAAKLSQSLAGQGGIDVVSVRSARGGSDEGSALVVGKYITPDLLVSYEQALKEKSTSYVVMEYMLTRYIKLETLYSNQSKSGLGLSVEKNY